jgi:hypothetical protein
MMRNTLTICYRTDIEQEVNGLYTFDRKPKLDPVKMKAIMDKAKQVYYDRIGKK